MDINQKIVLPTNDLSFKKVFSTPENKDILIGIINDFYGLEIVDVQIENPYSIEELNKHFEKNGYFKTEVDSICTASDNSKFTLEMQVEKLEYFVERSLYYLFTKYCSNYGNEKLMISKRSKYSSLFPTYSINILNYEYFLDDAAIHQFTLYDKKHKIKLADKNLITLGYFELPKDDDSLNQNLRYWKEYFKSGKADENAPDYIKKAGEIISLSNFSKEERHMIDFMEKIEQDRIAREIYVENEAMKKGRLEGREKGREEGREEGMTEGIVKEKREIAIRLLKMHLQIEQISEATNLTLEEISKLASELENQN